MADSAVTVVAGVGPGLGLALCRRFAEGGHKVAMLARSAERLHRLAGGDDRLHAYPCDVSDPETVRAQFEKLTAELGTPDVVIHNASSFPRASVAELDPADLERSWQIGCFGGFLIGQAAARLMQPRGQGTILFTGATGSLRGGSGFAAFAIQKFGLRALAQSMARELGPQGIHVAHVIIDGQIRSPRFEHLLEQRGPSSLLEPSSIAESYWQLHQQPRDAWTFEIELRPWVERF
jgi:NAD(P)-dependent dehydrogenase (short-subunit alcohol dehydrogenase family)